MAPLPVEVSRMPPSVMHARPSSEHHGGDLLDGRYRLVTRLGRGGFGDVWRAQELLPDGAPFREVALKLLIGDTRDARDAVDWAEEAKLLASFRHPSLVTIYAAGIFSTTVTPESRGGPSAAEARDALGLAHGATIADPDTDRTSAERVGHDTARVVSARLVPQRYVAMELLHGENLADVAKGRRRVPWRRVLAWARSAAAALDVIHEAGVVHLDLKPANLFLCADGTLKVLDFGIARRSGANASAQRVRHQDAGDAGDETRGGKTMPSHSDEAYAATHVAAATRGHGLVIGTPGYMAPEVLELKKPTAAADAYALAVCVVQLCTGSLPHVAPDEPETWHDPSEVSAWLSAIRAATLRGEMRELGESTLGLPHALAALLTRFLAVAPEARGHTSGSLAALYDEVWARPHGVPDPPYFVQRPYPIEAEGVLFGRDEDTARLGRELVHAPSLVVQGARGAGKSSLIAAGLTPYLAKLGVDGRDDWVFTPVRTQEDLDAALAALEREPAIGRVLALDPLEDMLACPFAHAIEELAERRSSGLRIIGALREETTDAWLASSLGLALRSGLRFVGPPATAAATEIIAGPARYAGVPLEGAEAIAEDVRHELRGTGPRLPFVAIALEEWWRTRGTSAPSTLSAARWRETGGIAGAAVRHAERVMESLERKPRAIAEELLLRLAATDGSALSWEEDELCLAVASATMRAPRSSRAPRDEAAHVAHVARVHDVLDQLKAELVVRRAVAGDGAGDGSGHGVEIGHEALLKDWPRLASARLAEMDRLLALERVREARVAWERADNHKDALMQGAPLADARARRALLDRGLSAVDRSFLEASFSRAKLRRAVRAVAIVVATSFLAAGGMSKRMLDEAREDELRAKAAAVELEQLGEIAAKARRTDDPYPRAALLAAAVVRGGADAMLPLDLYATAQNLARADFLTQERVEAPSFPWDDRFLVASTSATSLMIVDFRPSEPDVIEDIDIDADPMAASEIHFKRPAIHHLRPHEAPLVERVDFAFDTAFATRAADGEVKVFRIREDGAPALAAVAPMRCVGSLRVAASVPVLACGVDRDVVRWDLRGGAGASGSRLTRASVIGEVTDVSADGEHVAITTDRELTLWSPSSRGSGTSRRYKAERPLTVARFDRSGTLAAVLEGDPKGDHVTIVSVAEGEAVASFDALETNGVDLRWDEGGLDVAVCEAGRGAWTYLRKGGRAPSDPKPTTEPCAKPRFFGRPAPEPVSTLDGAPELMDRDVGPHVPTGGFRLHGHRYLTRDLVLLDPGLGREPMAPPDTSIAAASRLLRFQARDDIGAEETHDQDDSIAAVVRDDTAVIFQVGDEMRFYSLPDDHRLFVRKGNFLRRCVDGRILAWEVSGDSYRLFEAWTGGLLRRIPREPGFIIGAGGACRSVYTQRLDGTIVDHPLDSRPTRELGKADGYAFEARPSGGASIGSKTPPGLLVSFSSGAIARIDDATHTLTLRGYASPFARAVTDGPTADDIIFTDAAGITLMHAGAAPVSLGARDGLIEWSDLSLSRDGASLLLAAPDRVAALDITRREIVGSVPFSGKDHFVRWDDDGSLLLYSFERKGPTEGLLLPRGVNLAHRVAEAVSNLDVKNGKVVIRP